MKAGLRKMEKHQLREVMRRYKGTVCVFLGSGFTVVYNGGMNQFELARRFDSIVLKWVMS